jgi:Alpha/beta hydrolase domain
MSLPEIGTRVVTGARWRGLAGRAGLLALVVGSVLIGTVGASVGAAPAGASQASNAAYAAAAVFSNPPATGSIIEPESAQATDLGPNGYVENEYFASGTATAFNPVSTPANGKWSIKPATTAAYKTRILVRRPKSAAAFNGTVVVEWMNVSAGESAPDWTYLNPKLMKDGYAYVAVSTQAQAVDGGTALLGSASSGLAGSDPARYGTLHHPGDQYSLDMFAQIARAVRANTFSVLGPLRPKRMVAVGESQSAFYLTTFADAIQPLTHSFDGIFIHSRGGSSAPLNGAVSPGAISGALHIRTDLSVPVFMFETQTDLIELGYAPAQQPNTARIRTWEVAGTSHADNYIVGGAAASLGCTSPINSGPQHIVAQAAFTAFMKWVTNGTPPPSPAPFKLSSTNPAVLALDKNGNVIGGVRTPAVDVPVSTLSGAAPAGSSTLCSLFGSTTPFTTAQLTSLYQTNAHYLTLYKANLNKAVAKKYVLPADRAALLAQAAQVQF